jgi:hypothetical protein
MRFLAYRGALALPIIRITVPATRGLLIEEDARRRCVEVFELIRLRSPDKGDQRCTTNKQRNRKCHKDEFHQRFPSARRGNSNEGN